MSGPLTLLRRSAVVWAPVAVAEVAVQTALVASDPIPVASAVFIAVAVASLAALVAGVAITSRALALAASGAVVTWRASVSSGSSWLWASILVLLTALLAVVLPPLALLGVLKIIAIMPVASAGSPRVWRPIAHSIRAAPVRGVILGVVTLVVSVVVVVASLLLGFFVTGAASAVATWIVGCAAGLLLLAGATSYASRSSAVDRSGVKNT